MFSAGLLLLALVLATSNGQVVDLTDANFDVETATSDFFVAFTAPWCGFCMVRGYPTLLLVQNKGGKSTKYIGERSVSSFLSFLTENHSFLSSQQEKKVQLFYFNTRGRAEAIRLLLRDLGVDFEDTRIAREKWVEVKKEMMANGKLPFGQLPAFDYGSTHLVQSLAILRFLARKYNLYGADEFDVTQADMIADGLEDLRRRYGLLAYDKDWKNKAAEYRDVTLPSWLTYFERWLVNQGTEDGPALFFVGHRISFVDYLAFDLLDANLRIFPSCLDSFPNLTSFYKVFSARPSLAQYLASTNRTETHQNGVTAFFDNINNPGPLVF